MRWFGLGAMLLWSSALAAQEPVVLKLRPAAAPSPAMKHQLLPAVRDLQPGNAAVYYHRAHSPDWFRALERVPAMNQLHDWLEGPTGKLPEKEARQLLLAAGMFKDLDRAARCESCDWQMSARLREEGVALLLPELQSLRQMGQLLALKARIEALDGQNDAAVHTMQTGFAMGRHVGDCPIVINALVGIAIAEQMLGSVQEFVQRPGAPNLYWALRDLPEPFIDLRRPLQGDRLAVDAWWPEIRKALGERTFAPLPLPTLRASLDRVFAHTRYAEGRVEAAALVATAHPRAMAYFLKRGHTQPELDALPVTQVVLMHALAEWDRWYDAVYRWHNVPYWQARAGIRKATEERELTLRNDRDGTFLLQHLLPANDQAFAARARLQRHIAVLQVIEAIRLHAAAHQGDLPDTLDDLRDVPLPLDPVTGKAFSYTYNGVVARLRAEAPRGEMENARNTLTYEISIAK